MNKHAQTVGHFSKWSLLSIGSLSSKPTDKEESGHE